jgi:hypothetical protein
VKEHILPYLLKNDQYWCGLNVTNHSFDPTTILIDYFSSTGRGLKTEEIELKSGCSKQFNPDVPLGWARAYSNDNTTISEFIGEPAGTMYISIEKRDLVIENVVVPNKSLVPIQNTRFTEFVGSCPSLIGDFHNPLQWIARSLYYKFPGRTAQKLSIGDGCPGDGSNCPGHPEGSHRDGDTVDFDYFTMGATNHTQYGSSPIEIWTDSTSATSTLTDAFDAQRNMEFTLLMRRVFPNARVWMDARIYTAISLAAWQTYGDAGRDWVKFILQDSPMHYNHHTHSHWMFGGTVNWKAVL